MALNIKKTVTIGGMQRSGCYIQLKPIAGYAGTMINIDRAIWSSKDAVPNFANGEIPLLEQIPLNFQANPATAPVDESSSNVLKKFLYWLNTIAKEAIITKNEGWVDSDIDIVDL